MNLKEGMRHIYKKRIFYIDEDNWYILLGESYDKRDQLWRVNMLHAAPQYLFPSYVPTGVVTWYDLQARRYLAFGLVGGIDNHFEFDMKLPPKSEFSASSLRREGIR